MPTKHRNSSLDNVKGVLIFLVVFGHLIEMYVGDDHFLRSIWIFVYIFHMPMFALISGMFSKASLNEQVGLQLLKNIVVPLLCFEFLYEGTEFLLKGNISVYGKLIAPYWMLWYLLSLLSWRLLLPIFSKFQFPVVLAVLLALVTSYSEHAGYFLSLSRTLMFFPFFVLGWQLGPHVMEKRRPAWLLLSIPVAALAFIGTFLLRSDFDYRWLYGSFSLHRLEMANLSGSLYQLLQFTVCGVVGLAMVHLLTRRDLGLARIGQRSMYVFLWHGMPLIAMQESGLLQRIFEYEDGASLFMSLAATAAIVWLTAHPWCVAFTDRYLLAPCSWLLTRLGKPESLPVGAASQSNAERN